MDLSTFIENTAYMDEIQLLDFNFGNKEASLLIKSILGNDDILDRIGYKSYSHPNGFTKLVLHTSADKKSKIRLHFWNDSISSLNQDVHDHAWPFVSKIMAGRFINTIFDGQTDPDGSFLKCKFVPSSRDRYGYDHDVIDSCSLFVRSKTTYEAPSSYFFSEKEFHTFTPLTAPAWTIVWQLPSSKCSTSMFIEKNEVRARFSGLDRMKAAEVRNVFLTCLNSLRPELAPKSLLRHQLPREPST